MVSARVTVRGHVRVTIKVPISAWIRLQLIAARTATLVTSPRRTVPNFLYFETKVAPAIFGP